MGLKSINAFYEHIGCTPCSAFDAGASRAGPWIVDPVGVKLMGATSRYTNAVDDGFTCRLHGVSSREAGEFSFLSGPSVEASSGDGTWDKILYTCPEDGCSPPDDL